MVKIYTRTGDEGETHLFGGGRSSKNSKRVRAYGAVDELNAYLGVVRAHSETERISEMVRELQSLLFVCGADLASPDRRKENDDSDEKTRIKPEDTRQLEQWIDELSEDLDPLTQFVLPGGTPMAAHLQFARGICRRAEREVVALMEHDEETGDVLPFINRLSDLLFTMARSVNQENGVDEIPWKSPLQ